MENIKFATNVNKDEKINKILMLGLLICTIGTFTLDTFLSSLRVEVIFILISTVVFIVYYLINNKGLTLYRTELMWLAFLVYFLFNILYQGNFTKIFYADILIFAFMFVFLYFVKIDINYYDFVIKIMLAMAIMYALSSIFQYLNMELYSRTILPRFTELEREEILRIYGRGSYTGFTWQSAYISGYLIYGIGIALFIFKEIRHKIFRISAIVGLPLMFFSLILGGKRAHLLFMIIALLITYLFSTELRKLLLQIIKIFAGITTMILGVIIFFSFYTPEADSQFGKIYNRFLDTVNGFLAGEDITSGRTLLYDYALKLYNESPMFGIGWRKFSQLSSGIINSDRGSHPHNIYFQLLTELGLVGFMLFIIPVVYIFIKTIRLLMNADSLFSYDRRWKIGLQFSLYVQTFFILYGITGNLLTDHMYMLMYVFAVSISLSSIKYAGILKLTSD